MQPLLPAELLVSITIVIVWSIHRHSQCMSLSIFSAAGLKFILLALLTDISQLIVVFFTSPHHGRTYFRI